MKVVKRELCRHRHQEMVQDQAQVYGSPDGSQQVCLPVQLGQGGGHLPAAHPQRLVHGQQPQGLDPVHVQRQTAQGGTVPNMEPQQMDDGWEAPEVTVKVRPQKLSQGWEAPEVTVQVQPQKLSPRWEMPEVTVQVQLQQRGRGPALPQVTVQVQPQVQGQRMAGIKVTVQMHSGCEPEEVTRVQDQGEEVLENGEQLIQKQNQGDSMARSEGERELAEMELAPQGAWNQKQDQEGEVIKLQQEQSQNRERAEVTELQEMQVEDQAGLDRMVTEEKLQDQSQEQEKLKADLSPQQEGQRDTEMRQDQSDVHIQEGFKGLVEEQQEDLEQEVPKKRPRETPNYFVSIPITDDQILDRIEDVQELVFTKEPDLLRAFLPVQTMHLTIIVAHLATEEEVKKAVLALKQSKAKVEAILQGEDLIMTFHGIGQFNNQVIYVKMSEENHKMLSRIATVEECFNEMNLDISGSKDFKPHLTFLKLSKAPRLKRRGFRKICSDLYKEYENSFFGTEVFSQIDLCAMRKKKQESGYYYCECSINVGSRGTEESKEQEMQTEDKGETSSEDPPSSAAGTETGATAASCYLASHPVAADDKQSENIAEVLIASKEKEINEVNGQPEATDETFLAAGESCSESVPALLPVRLDALLRVEGNQEKAKITDDRLQKTEATECAPDLPTSSG
ncbi:neurofilament light polypeptide-like isoform X2 [Anser cygnoides]|uniref:neurofilament light polypeptide-like isoform X2 n=1 Tax=Anser cygnoides TaxID=8845 RepID=UPI0034D2C37F